MSESRVRENRMHGLRRRGLETERHATAPVPDPTQPLEIEPQYGTAGPHRLRSGDRPKGLLDGRGVASATV
jgi:hypothetical protein